MIVGTSTLVTSELAEDPIEDDGLRVEPVDE